jgi:hypothetical protein
MIVAGRVSNKMAPVLRQIYDQMPEPRWVLAMGVCASSGGMFNNYAIVQGVDHIVPVDMYLPGCPPRPEMLMDAILKIHAKIMDEPLGRRRPPSWPRAGHRTELVPPRSGGTRRRERSADAAAAAHRLRRTDRTGRTATERLEGRRRSRETRPPARRHLQGVGRAHRRPAPRRPRRAGPTPRRRASSPAASGVRADLRPGRRHARGRHPAPPPRPATGRACSAERLGRHLRPSAACACPVTPRHRPSALRRLVRRVRRRVRRGAAGARRPRAAPSSRSPSTTEITFYVQRESIVEMCRTLRDDPALRFELCSSVSGGLRLRVVGHRLHAAYHLTVDDLPAARPARGSPRRRGPHAAEHREVYPTADCGTSCETLGHVRGDLRRAPALTGSSCRTTGRATPSARTTRSAASLSSTRALLTPRR